MPDDQETPATNVVEALRRVMRDLPAIGKGEKMAGDRGYAYRGIEQITRECQGLFVRHGVVFTPRVVGVPEVVDITVNGKPWTDTRMLVEYDIHGPGGLEDRITVGPIFAIGRDNSDKGANKCMTQAYKYALIQTFTIADSKDDGDSQVNEAEHRYEDAGNPYRQATLRADITSADITRMRQRELDARLEAAGLERGGTITAQRDRLTEHLLSGAVAAPTAPTITGTATPDDDGVLCFAKDCPNAPEDGHEYCLEHSG